MKYRDILGFSKPKKKVVKKQSKPKKTVLDNIKEEILKESYVWERKFGESLPTLTSIQKKKLKEVGAATEYRKYTQKIEKSFRQYLDDIDDLGKILLKKDLKYQARLIHKEYKKKVLGFQAWLRGQIDRLL